MKKNKVAKKTISKATPPIKASLPIPKPKPKKRKKQKKIVQIIGMNMEEVYAAINKTQIDRVEQELIVDPKSTLIIEHILKDCDMLFTKASKADGMHFTIQPPPKKIVSEDLFVFTDELPDELLEDGFCF